MQLRRGLLRALRNTGIIVIYQTPDMRVLWAQNVPAEWSEDDIFGKTDADFLSGPMAERIVDVKREVLATGVSEKLEFHAGVEHGGRWYDMWIDADRGEEDEIAGHQLLGRHLVGLAGAHDDGAHDDGDHHAAE